MNKSDVAAIVLFAGAAISAAAIPSTAAAQQVSPWYVTGAVGQSRYDIDLSGITGDRKGTVFNIGGGYRLSPNVALELGYTDFGKANYLNVDLKAKTTYGAVVLSAPLGEAFSLFGKLGYGSTKRSASSPDIVIPLGPNGSLGSLGSFGFSNHDRKSEAIYGLGAGYAFTPNITGTIEWQRLDNTKVDAGMVGVRFGF